MYQQTIWNCIIGIKASELALTPWQKERLPDFKKSLKKREEEIFG